MSVNVTSNNQNFGFGEHALTFAVLSIGFTVAGFIAMKAIECVKSCFSCCCNRKPLTENHSVEVQGNETESSETVETAQEVEARSVATTVQAASAPQERRKLQPQKNPDEFAKAVAIAIKAGDRGITQRQKLIEIFAKYSTEIQGRDDITAAFKKLQAAQGKA